MKETDSDYVIWVCFCLQEEKQKEVLTRKQAKNKAKQSMFAEDDKKTELLEKPREYTVKFTFPNPTPLNPPILGAHGEISYSHMVILLKTLPRGEMGSV